MFCYYHNPNFGLITKAKKVIRVWAKKSVGMKTHTPKWTLLLGIRVLKDSRTFREWLQRSIHLALRSSLYHWKVIEVYMSKMGSHRPNFHVCRLSAIPHWKALDKSYNFALDLIPIRGLSKKLWLQKVAESSLSSFLGVLRQKRPFGCGSREETQEIYMGEGGGFPRIQAVVNLVSPRLPVICLSTKGVPT